MLAYPQFDPHLFLRYFQAERERESQINRRSVNDNDMTMENVKSGKHINRQKDVKTEKNINFSIKEDDF